MQVDDETGISDHLPGADESAMGAIFPLYVLKCFSGPSTVTLSTFATLSVNSAKGLARWAARCFAALSMTGLAPLRMS